MTIPKPNLTLILITIIAIMTAVIACMNGCHKTQVATQQSDSIRALLASQHQSDVEYDARLKSWNQERSGLIKQLDDTTAALQQSRKEFAQKGARILSTNKDLHAALIIHDTPVVYKNAEYLSFQIDSISTVAWTVGRQLDAQIVLNEQLRYKDSSELAAARAYIDATRHMSSILVQEYEVQHQQDQLALKKAQRKSRMGKVVFGAIGFAAGTAVKAITSLFK